MSPLAIARWTPGLAGRVWAETETELMGWRLDEVEIGALDYNRARIAQKAEKRMGEMKRHIDACLGPLLIWISPWMTISCDPTIDPHFYGVHLPECETRIAEAGNLDQAKFIASFIEVCEEENPGEGVGVFKAFWEVGHGSD